MKAEQLQLSLRPRPSWEAVDLGVRLAQAAAPALLRAWLPFALGVAVASLATIELAAWLPFVLIGAAKPWLERGVLHVLARHVFGESTTFMQAWAARAAAPWLPMVAALTWGRLVPWRAFTAPVIQLEGQHGSARRKRLQQLASGHRGAGLLSQFMFGLFEVMLTFGLLGVVAVLTPGVDWAGVGAFFRDSDEHVGSQLLMASAFALASMVVTPLHAAAGFALYLNRRADLEAWDVEQDLREAFAPEAAR